MVSVRTHPNPPNQKDKKLQLHDFTGALVREWSLDTVIRYIKARGRLLRASAWLERRARGRAARKLLACAEPACARRAGKRAPVAGGPPGREMLLVGLTSGQVVKICVDNPFPIPLVGVKPVLVWHGAR